MKTLGLLLPVSLSCALTLNADWRTYRQTIELTYGSPEEAAQAQLTAIPLPPGKKIAFSSRWDDTHPDHVKMADTLSAQNCKGTFYLNRIDQKYVDAVLRKAFAKGFTIGVHTVSHPHLPQLSPNAIFKEILANRIALETTSDTCVSTFTLPFVSYTSPSNPAMPRIIGDCLRRAGLLGGPEYWPDMASRFGLKPQEWSAAYTFKADDKNPQLSVFEKGLQQGLAGIDRFECGPHLVVGIHTWQKTEENFNRLGSIVATVANRPDWWYCNESEYAAHRMQFFHSAIAKKTAAGKTATFTIDRPVPAELGDLVALSLKASPAPLAAKLNGAPFPLPAADGAFALPHDTARPLPVRIETALPGLALDLHVAPERNKLTCSFANTSGTALQDVQLTFRIPPQWKNGVIKKDIGSINTGDTRNIELDLGDKNPDPLYAQGAPFFALQCDMTDTQGAIRMYRTAELAPTQP